MLHGLASDGGSVALIWAAEDREGRHTEKGCQEPAVQQKTENESMIMMTSTPTAHSMRKSFVFLI